MLSTMDDNFELVLHALNNPPSLILDCANCANPHRFYPYVPYENYKRTYVISIDAIYRFRDTLKDTKKIAENLNVKTIVITSFDYLYAFGDDEEVDLVIEHCKELIMKLSKNLDVFMRKPKKQFPISS